ncbi:MAG: elongation factor G, partial [Candidatus Margulisbacteria bacterium]|nr:elongation factor G [Candidatus Margulisiibacteriota bacterium]
MKEYPPSKIHNIGIIGSAATGKTSLAEALLFKAGAISRLGNIKEGTTTSDYDPEEIKRGISIHSTLLPFEWQDHKINLIDTPGYIDFIGEAISIMRVVDSLIIVVDAVTGHGTALETLWKLADRYNLPRMIVVNKLDKSQANFEEVLNKMRKKFSVEVVPVQVPDGREADFKGVKSLRSPQVAEEHNPLKEMLIEGVAEIDDTILTEYLEGQEITEQELTEHVITALDEDKIFPVFAASATKGLGIEEILDATINWMPKANEKEHCGRDKEDKDIVIKTEPKEPFSAYVFKTVTEPHIGNLAYIRVYSGTIKPSSPVLNSCQGKDERIGQIISMRGKNKIELSSLSAGDIAVLPKLKLTAGGDTLCDKNRQIIFEKASFPKPVMSFSVKPKSKSDQEKMGLGLGSFAGEDPTFHLAYNSETKETVISGMGDVHLEVILKKLKERYNIDIEIGEPRIPYKETIKGKIKTQGKYKKQTGGRGQYGDTWIEIEPLPRGSGFEFVNKIVGGAIPKNYIPAVEKGIIEAMAQGIVAGYPAIDIKVTLYDGSYHEVDSSDMAFKIAGSMGFKKGFVDAKPTLLEPIVEITVHVPPEFVGEATGDLNKRRGRISNIETDKIVALVPQGEISKYATELRSFTHGQGTFSTKFSHYEEV